MANCVRLPVIEPCCIRWIVLDHWLLLLYEATTAVSTSSPFHMIDRWRITTLPSSQSGLSTSS